MRFAHPRPCDNAGTAVRTPYATGGRARDGPVRAATGRATSGRSGGEDANISRAKPHSRLYSSEATVRHQSTAPHEVGTRPEWQARAVQPRLPPLRLSKLRMRLVHPPPFPRRGYRYTHPTLIPPRSTAAPPTSPSSVVFGSTPGDDHGNVVAVEERLSELCGFPALGGGLAASGRGCGGG